MPNTLNLVRHQALVTKNHRQALNGHRSVALWFTGLSGSGKSTLAHAVEEHLFQQGCRTYVFDGDNVRHGLCRDLGFSPADRRENLRRIAEMLNLFLDAGVISMAAFISPFAADREMVKEILGNDNFIEIFCKCSLAVCEQRDVKGLYAKARAGKIANYTGISSPYEVPTRPDLSIDTERTSIADCVSQIIVELHKRGVFQSLP